MNRRSILSTLCTGALALLAPVVAYAKPRRWVGFHNRGVKPMVITPREGSAVQQRVTDWRHVDWSDEKATLVVRASYLKTLHEAALDHHQTILQLRALLADARETRVGNGNPDYLRALERVAVAAYSATDADESWAGYVESQNKIDDLLEVLCDEHRAAFTAALKGHRNA